MSTCAYAHVHMYMCSCAYVHMLMCTCTYAHVHMYICSCAHVHMLMCTCTYAMCTCTLYMSSCIIVTINLQTFGCTCTCMCYNVLQCECLSMQVYKALGQCTCVYIPTHTKYRVAYLFFCTPHQLHQLQMAIHTFIPPSVSTWVQTPCPIQTLSTSPL